MEQTFDKLTTLQLHGMVDALRRFGEHASAPDLSPIDLVGLLADAECAYRDNRKLQIRLKQAKLRQQASIEDIDYRHPRGLSKPLLLDLSSSRWVSLHQNIILTGKTGVGEKLSRMRAGSQGVSRRLHRHLPPILPLARRARTGSC